MEFLSLRVTVYRSYGVLVWEVATYGETPHEQLPTSNIVEMANDGSLKLDKYALSIML